MILAVDDDLPAENAGIRAIAPPPERVADDDDAFAARLFFVRGELAALRDRHAEKREEVGGHASAAEALRFAIARDVAFPRPQGADAAEHGAGLLPLQVRLHGDRQARELIAPLRNDHFHAVDFVRLGIGQRPQQHRVDDAEDGRVRADAEREREHGDAGESRASAEHPRRMPRVVPELLQPRPSPRGGGVFRDQREAAKLASGRGASLIARQSSRGSLVGLLGQMELELVAKVGFLAPPIGQPPQLAQKSRHHGS